MIRVRTMENFLAEYRILNFSELFTKKMHSDYTMIKDFTDISETLLGVI